MNATEERSEDAPEGFDRDTFVGMSFALPLPIWNNNSGRVQEAVAAATRAELEIRALALAINAEAIVARDTMAVLQKLVTSLQNDLLPTASKIEERLRTSYSTGQTTLVEVLRARDRRLLLDRQRTDALRDYHLARVRYDAATGRNIRGRTTINQRGGK
jgi:cobalt-zinc-cadmium efflux system outer membrane protein